ncbi:MAG: mycothiol system anti-sigma-R factor [Micrococcales bacterium]|nr:mycothiol system anti-sigma-R factor [Micrococcales bacterium]
MTGIPTPNLVKDPVTGIEIDCDQAMATLFTFIDAELDVHELEEMRGHLDDCPECLYEEELGRKLKGVIQRTCVERAPDQLRERVISRLTELRQVKSA